MQGIKVELILWSNDKDFNIDEAISVLGIPYSDKEKKGEIVKYGEKKQLWRVATESSVVYSTQYVKTNEIMVAVSELLDIINPKMPMLINVINKYQLHSKICVAAYLPEKPIVYLSSGAISLINSLSAEFEMDYYIFSPKTNLLKKLFQCQ